MGKVTYDADEQRILRAAFQQSFEAAGGKRSTIFKGIADCSCSGCSCPPDKGNICDAATMVGYSGGYYGALSVHVGAQ
jgi:hypothetical protein